MSEDKSIKLFKAAKELNIGTGTIVDFLAWKG
jgi:translation initiation factor IF-2